MAEVGNHPSREAIGALLDLLAPGSSFIAVHELPGSFSNYTHVVEARDADGSTPEIGSLLTQCLIVDQSRRRRQQRALDHRRYAHSKIL